ncbi:anti-sigma B factor RsbW [Heyndrickxia oleronia]|uniref:anti-sigma B factor RsbW n=1 Tax=Heyndrickxia oleronia TaxID=38875 RepID=UPI00203C159D|nr:anti-sigma B factor RsbW [Heyndrickxia oleronia]MCM3239938.1 anti-sigma B factor RsbW [Heyndrickxia oleronia]
MVVAFDCIEMKIPAKPEYIGVIRLTISGIASRMGFAYEMIEDLKIATSEAITNAVQHAYKGNPSKEIIIGFSVYEDKLEIKVADQGKSFDVGKTKEKTGPYLESETVEFMREGGLGLYLIESLMDEVKIHYKEGVTVIMTKYLEGEQVETDAQIVST